MVTAHALLKDCTAKHLCNLGEENIRVKDRYLVKVLLEAAKKKELL